MIAMNCSGTNAYRYGPMKDWVISTTVVLSDGSVLKTKNRPHKSASGYDLTKLMVGSEGTLGIVTEAVLKVTHLPQEPHVGIAIFPNTESAIRACIKIMLAGQFDAVEFIDRNSLHAVNKSGISSLQWQEKPSIFLKYSGNSEAIGFLTSVVRNISSKYGCHEVKISSGDEGKEWWHMRKTVVHALLFMKSETDLFLTCDAAVPRSCLIETVKETQKAAERSGFFCSATGHVGDGNVHTGFVVPKDREEEGLRLIEFVRKMALRLEGTISGEHSIGTHLRTEPLEEVGFIGVTVMQKIKLALDPQCILSPGKVLHFHASDQGINGR